MLKSTEGAINSSNYHGFNVTVLQFVFFGNRSISIHAYIASAQINFIQFKKSLQFPCPDYIYFLFNRIIESRVVDGDGKKTLLKHFSQRNFNETRAQTQTKAKIVFSGIKFFFCLEFRNDNK